MMKKFDMKRFGQVLKLDFAEGRKAMMWGALCMTLLYLFFFWFAWNIGFHDSRFDYINNPDERLRLQVSVICEAVGSFSAIAMFFFLLIGASTLYRGEQKKQQRIAWLMLPASNREKFLSRWIYLVVFSLVGGLLSFFVADLAHIAYLWMSDNPVMTTIDDFFYIMPHVPEGGGIIDLLSTIMMYSFLIALHAFYLLGGVFFKKFHFIAVSALVVILFVGFVGVFNMLVSPGQPNPVSHTFYYISVTIFWTLVITLFTWLAYRLFCRWQVVTHKFANV
ncbi:MAG: hypothetical protein J6W19_07240 [Prevotella sp.]|nr:hypothetical protein [Prevotella sp.]